MIVNKTSPFLKALAREPVEYTPIWIMRQAGRYLPEYREIRAKAGSFLNLCRNPELACEVTLQPLRRFPLDAAIIFSDILTIPDAMGLELYFEANEGPRFRKRIQDEVSIMNLPIPNIEADLNYVMDAIRLVVKELAGSIPLIGFAGSPWTLAAYMVEGGSSKNFNSAKRFMFNNPEAFTELLERLVKAVSIYLKAQILAGVEALMIFDTWGGLLTSDDYELYSLKPVAKIISNIKQDYEHIPIILFTKQGSQWLSAMANSGANALGVDWTIDVGVARKIVANKVALQGNLDPALLYASPHRIRQEVKKILKSYGYGSGHIFNLGHGISPDTPYENVKILIEYVHELSRPYHL
jgi:uroporphyrinogen decarboxylase